ncbi:hypothetical protein QMM35_11315 [Leptospira santarosai]|nr:hypothetical protein [Leptospira santarosai]MDI7174821.1 hypothetical protein [Leptospira santarosai]MDI7193820.1 hypothetical protein [Leptospira santarosai]MDO6395578.1 hypothetical protein [Leptospira santarosai]MDO6398873.1 hypothetical protein [Leptospira santarosai]MDO6403659.1 hypothetical protein [Leptospira santarosai]
MLGTIKQYKRRLSAAVAILGIAATALSYCSKSSFGYSVRTTIPKLTLFFTNPIKAIGRLQSEPIPESVHITPDWEVAADIKITLEVAEFIENDDFSKRTNLEQTEEHSYFQETEGSLTEGIQVEKEILNLNPNLELKVQPRLRNGKLRNETIGSLQNTFEIHDAPSDPILIRESVVDLKTLDLTSLYSVPWEWETDTFEIRILENMNIDRWVWEHIQEAFQEVRTVNLETSFPSLSESAKEKLLYLPRRDQTRKNPHELARESVYKNTDSKSSSFKTDLPRFPSLRIDRKQMRYYAIQMHGPPPTDHKQV